MIGAAIVAGMAEATGSALLEHAKSMRDQRLAEIKAERDAALDDRLRRQYGRGGGGRGGRSSGSGAGAGPGATFDLSKMTATDRRSLQSRLDDIFGENPDAPTISEAMAFLNEAGRNGTFPDLYTAEAYITNPKNWTRATETQVTNRPGTMLSRGLGRMGIIDMPTEPDETREVPTGPPMFVPPPTGTPTAPAPQGFSAAGGPAPGTPAPAPAAQPAQTWPGAPAVGAIVNGYRYLGGDPNSPDSWEKV